MVEQHAGHGHGEHGDGHGQHHPTLKVYYLNFAALMVLLVLTLVAAAFDLGQANLLIAVTIAVVKALLVVLFFMHLYYNTRLIKVFAGAALFWLLIMFLLTLGDYFARRGPMHPA